MELGKAKRILDIGYGDPPVFRIIGGIEQGYVLVPWVFETVLPPIIIGADVATNPAILTRYALTMVNNNYYGRLPVNGRSIN